MIDHQNGCAWYVGGPCTRGCLTSWEEWAETFHGLIKAIISDIEALEPEEGSPTWQLHRGLAAATKQYELACAERLATQDTERLDLPER